MDVTPWRLSEARNFCPKVLRSGTSRHGQGGLIFVLEIKLKTIDVKLAMINAVATCKTFLLALLVFFLANCEARLHQLWLRYSQFIGLLDACSQLSGAVAHF